MEYNNENLLELLDYIDPALLDYTEWTGIGMALKDAGYKASDWDAWSRRDLKRYHPGECERKWDTFTGTGITAGTLVKMALDNGYKPAKADHELDWNDTIDRHDEFVVVDKNWIEAQDIHEPEKWKPAAELIRYLETLFDSTDTVGYVTESWEKDGKYMPKSGSYTQTAGELCSALYKCGDDLGAVLGDYNPAVGAWIRFNPLDGKGVKNENITEYRYALVESDSMDIASQNAVIRELELPVACLVYSGGKSLHAIVRVDAGSYEEYRARVDYLYKVCAKNGLDIDKQNRNPSRLSRMPGVVRGEHKQFLVDTNIGKSSFEEWRDWIESVNDDLPDEENLSTFFDDLPALAPPLIEGVLRQGHKMLVAGPSKAGKSYLLIELCCCIAEGKPWLSFPCTAGRVLYVNLELDRASCLHRFRDVYTALGFAPEHIDRIDIWNLRGRSVPMDKLAPKLIRRAAKKSYMAIVIDPIYKVITGDENSADQMAHFCNQFDKVCTELGCAVIYCHHHSKGGQGGKKSMDRASGSGVFARDPDALIDLIELELTDGIKEQQENRAVCAVCLDWLTRYRKADEAGDDDRLSATQMMALCKKHLREASYNLMLGDVSRARTAANAKSAWRVEGTLREFPRFAPKNFWFDYPIHRADETGILLDLQAENATPKGTGWKQNFGRKKTPQERKKEREASLDTAFEAVGEGGKASVKELSEYLGVSEKTVRNYLKDSKDFELSDGEVSKTGKGKYR